MLKKFCKYVFPAMLAFMFSGLYCIVDGFFVGQNIGDVGLAAINIAYPIAAFIQAVGTGIGMGGAVLISEYRGKNDENMQQHVLATTLKMLIVACIIMMIGLFLCYRPLLHFLGAEGTVYQEALIYTKIIIIGIFFQTLAVGLTPILRNFSAVLLAMMSMIIGFVTNIILDYLFVSRFQYGIAGAAWATIIGQAAALMPCMIFILFKIKRYKKSKLGFNLPLSIIKIGCSPFGLTMSPNIILILMNKYCMMVDGSVAVAAYAVIAYVHAIILLLLQGVSDGSQPMLSFYYGCHQFNSLSIIKRYSYILATIVALLNIIIILMFNTYIPQFFNASPQASEMVIKYMPSFAISSIFAAICRVSSAYCYSTHRHQDAYLLIYGEIFILWALLIILPRWLNIDGVFYAMAFMQIIMCCVSIYVMKLKKQEHIS